MTRFNITYPKKRWGKGRIKQVIRVILCEHDWELPRDRGRDDDAPNVDFCRRCRALRFARMPRPWKEVGPHGFVSADGEILAPYAAYLGAGCSICGEGTGHLVHRA